jgi:predicted AlkP superfamily pyrophosphatase or phosphodiesterase
MKRFFASLLLSSALACYAQLPKPKLVVIVVVDQFRADYLSRFRTDYTGGFDRMLREGANFTNARYEHMPTVTAVGHSIISTGAMPAVSGIIGNSWIDRAHNNKQVTAVCDFEEKVVGGATPKEQPTRCIDQDPASPRRLLVSTVGDELRNRDENSRVIGVSLKARSAILPAGHRANGAFWFDDSAGNFITSTYYSDDLPQWVKDFNGQKLAAQYIERKWDNFPKWDFHSKNAQRPYDKIPASPWGNELIEALAERAIVGEQLGQRGVTDLLTVSFSSNDYVGHAVGPDAPEVRDMAIRTDALLGKLFAVISDKVGFDNTIVVLSADHGVSPAPAAQKLHKMPGGYVSVDVGGEVTAALNKKFGDAQWVLPGVAENALYFNYQTLKEKKIDLRAVTETAAEAIMSEPKIHASRVYTRDQILSGGRGDFITTALLNGFHPGRSADLVIVYEPYYVPGSGGATGTTHFSPYVYDNHVPVVFVGMGVKAGTYRRNITVNDIAPTLAAAMGVEIPSGAYGNVLPEVVQ